MAKKTIEFTPVLEAEYAELWSTMQIKDTWRSAVYRTAKMIHTNKDKYKAIGDACNGIPWWFIGVIHNLECGLDFTKHLHNGDSLKGKTYRVPKGRIPGISPPYTFNQSAEDAMTMKGFHRITDWSMPHVCYLIERYNGFGYRLNKNRPLSPYLWSGSQHYTKGKYVADHKYNPNAVSEQIGTMPLIKAILDVDTPMTIAEATSNSRRMSFQKNANRFITYSGLGGLSIFGLLQDARAFVTDNAGWILLGVGASAWFIIKWIMYRSDVEVKEQRYVPDRE